MRCTNRRDTSALREHEENARSNKLFDLLIRHVHVHEHMLSTKRTFNNAVFVSRQVQKLAETAIHVCMHLYKAKLKGARRVTDLELEQKISRERKALTSKPFFAMVVTTCCSAPWNTRTCAQISVNM